MDIDKVRLFYLAYGFLYLNKGHPVDEAAAEEAAAKNNFEGGCSAIIG